MAPQTGRTSNKFVNLKVDDSGAVLRQIPISSISVVGVVYEEQDLTAFQDAVKSALPGMPDAPIEIDCPFDTTALTGSHTVLSGINGGMTPLSLGVFIGMRHAWDAEPTFGLTSTATSGYICSSYTVDPNTMHCHAKFVLYPGSSLPVWSTADIT